MAAKPQASRASSFSEHLKQALQLIDQPAQLGSQSPLAAPYFLGEALRDVDATPEARGQALRAAIDRCLTTMWGGPLPDDGREMLDTALGDEDQGFFVFHWGIRQFHLGKPGVNAATHHE